MPEKGRASSQEPTARSHQRPRVMGLGAGSGPYLTGALSVLHMNAATTANAPRTTDTPSPSPAILDRSFLIM
jgi:hypothetical protein